MSRKSMTTKRICGDVMELFNPDWDQLAFATIRDDYKDEIQRITWSKNGDYLRNKEYGYLHVYIMKKWYGDAEYSRMVEQGCVVDHMNNNGFDCVIENLCFLAEDSNIAKGHNLDKRSRDKRFIALCMFKDFHTGLHQISISYNYPARLICEEDSDAVVDGVHLLYTDDYEMMINDAQRILLEYQRDKTFNPSKLSYVDYHIEGRYGKQPSLEAYTRYLEGDHNHTVVFMSQLSMIPDWTTEKPIHRLRILGTPSKHH